MASQVKIDATAVSNFLRETDGPVVRQFMVLGERVKLTTIARLKDGFPREFLGPSIVKRLTIEANGPHIAVGSEHVRTQPHIIRGNPLLVFRWKKMGNQLVFFRKVNHPGSNFHDYLIKTLLEAVDLQRGHV